MNLSRRLITLATKQLFIMLLKEYKVNNLKKKRPPVPPLTAPHEPKPVVRAVIFSPRNPIFSSKMDLKKSAWVKPCICRVQNFLGISEKRVQGKYRYNYYFVMYLFRQ